MFGAPRRLTPSGTASTSTSLRGLPPSCSIRDADADRAKLQALAKQLSQLDAAGSKIGETCRFIADLQGSKDTKVDLDRAPQQRKQLQNLRKKLQATVAELTRLESIASAESANNTPRDLEGAPTVGVEPAETTPLESFDRPSLERSYGQTTFERESLMSPTTAAALAGGNVSSTVAKITVSAAAAEAASNLRKLEDEMRRLLTIQKEIEDLQRSNDELRASVAAAGDVRALREQVIALQHQANEVANLQTASNILSENLERLPLLRDEVARMQPTGVEVALLVDELRMLRSMDEERHVLRQEISSLQPKVVLVERMRTKRAQMETTLAAAEPMTLTMAELQAEVDKLPDLRQRMYSLKAGAAEVRQLERILQDYGKQEEFKARLQERETELLERVSGIEELKRQVDLLQASAVEADLLESRFASLASVANRLPNLRAQNEALKLSCAEVEQLEKEFNRLKEAVNQRTLLSQEIETLIPQLAGLEDLRREADDLQQQVLASEEDLVARSHSNMTAGEAYTPRNTRGSHDGRSKTLPTRGFAAAAYVAAAAATVQAPALHEYDELEATTSQALLPGPIASRSLHEYGQQLALPTAVSITLREPPVTLPISVKQVEEVAVSFNIHVPPLWAELTCTREEIAALQAAEVELRGLEAHKAKLEEEVELMRRGVAAAEIRCLQARLLELQQQEVESLQRQVDSLADTGDRLVKLRSELAALEADADEVYLIEMQLPELEVAAARAGESRAKRAALEAQLEVAVEAEAAIERLQHVGERRVALELQLIEMNRNADEVDNLSRELAASSDIAVQLANLYQARSQLLAQHDEVEALTEENELMAAHLREVDGLRARHAGLEEEHCELLRLAAETSVLNRDNEVLRMQLNVAVAMFSATVTPQPAANNSVGSSSDMGSSGVDDMIARAARASGGSGAETGGGGGGSTPEEQVLTSLDSFRAMDAAVSSIITSPATPAPAQPASPLDSVFLRLRVLEAEKLALGAENEELRSEVERLQDALEASADLASRLRGISQTMIMIRGGNKPAKSNVKSDVLLGMSGGNGYGDHLMEPLEEEPDALHGYDDSPPAGGGDFAPDFALGAVSSPAR